MATIEEISGQGTPAFAKELRAMADEQLLAQQFVQQGTLPEMHGELQDRIKRAVPYFVQKLEVVERDIFKAADEKVALWRSGKCATGDIAQFYAWLDTLVAKTYLNEFGIKEN